MYELPVNMSKTLLIILTRISLVPILKEKTMKYTITLALLLILLLVTSCDTTVIEQLSCVGGPGDINLDGEVTAFDASLALGIVQGSYSPNDCQALAADFDGDGDIDMDDANAIWESIN